MQILAGAGVGAGVRSTHGHFDGGGRLRQERVDTLVGLRTHCTRLVFGVKVMVEPSFQEHVLTPRPSVSLQMAFCDNHGDSHQHIHSH
jgi:hypothetical protein